MEGENKTKKIIYPVVGALVLIILVACFVIAAKNVNNVKSSSSGTSASSESASKISQEYDNINYGSSKDVDNSGVVNITNGGSYNLSGSYEQIVINTTQDVELNLNNVEITCTNGPAINVENAGTVSIVLTGTNKITATTTEDLDGAIYSKDDLIFSGTGGLEVKSNYDGIVSKDTLVIKSGTYTIDASDDGINAGNKSSNYSVTVEINGGDITISMGQGDTDGIDSNGNLYINGGTINVTANSPFDYDGTAEYNGGTLIVNGEETNTITNQMMGGGMMNGEMGQGMQGEMSGGRQGRMDPGMR